MCSSDLVRRNGLWASSAAVLGLTLRIAPIVTRARNCDDTMCTVDLYFLRLWSFPGRVALDDYATVEIHDVRENDDWRLRSSSLIDGLNPADDSASDATPRSTHPPSSLPYEVQRRRDNK